MNKVIENYKISAKIYVYKQLEILDLKAVSSSQVGADNPDSFNQEPLKWEKEEKNGLVRIKSADFKDHYLGTVVDGGICKAVLGEKYYNTWFEKIEDGTSKEFFIRIPDKSNSCYDSAEPKYLTLGETVKGKTPITFEKEKPEPKRTQQKWIFTKASTNFIPKKG